jgi:hypothetical protein
MKIACWSGPRNISTALMRSWSSRQDTVVIDEPFYASYLKSTKLAHPMCDKIIEEYPSSYKEMTRIIIGENPKLSPIWYQKHMAHHLVNLDNLDFILSFKNSILIRHPKDVILSYTKKNKLSHSKELGYSQQYEIIKFLKKNNRPFDIIDSNMLLENPERILKKWCSNIKIDFDPKMMEWQKGIHATDGIWAKYWYDSVINSMGFQEKNNEIKMNLDKQFLNIYSECLDLYNEMYSFAIK